MIKLSHTKQSAGAFYRIVPLIAAAAFAAWPQGSFAGVLDPVGPVGAGDKAILIDSLAIMLAVIIPVIGMTIWFAWWFRSSNHKAKHLPDWEYSGSIELVVWSIPAMIVLFLGGIAWVGSHQLDPYRPLASKEQPIHVQVVSMDWKWLFIYPDQGLASVNQLMIPVGVPVEFSITSADVFNTFFVPRLGSQIYAMAGMVTKLNLQADQPGTYPGLSAHFSGDGFSDMRFNAIAVAPDQFASWVKSTGSTAPLLDKITYDTLMKPSEANPVALYRGIQPGLFDQIVATSAPDMMAHDEASGLPPEPAQSISPMHVKE